MDSNLAIQGLRPKPRYGQMHEAGTQFHQESQTRTITRENNYTTSIFDESTPNIQTSKYYPNNQDNNIPSGFTQPGGNTLTSKPSEVYQLVNNYQSPMNAGYKRQQKVRSALPNRQRNNNNKADLKGVLGGKTVKGKVYDNNTIEKPYQKHQTIDNQSSEMHTFTDYTQNTRKTAITAAKTGYQQSPVVPGSQDRFQTLNSIYNIKDSIYKVHGNKFTQGQIPVFDSSQRDIYGREITSDNQTSEAQTIDKTNQRSVVFTASPNIKRSDQTMDYNKLNGLAPNKTYFNVQSSNIYDDSFNNTNTIYDQLTSLKSRNPNIKANKSADVNTKKSQSSNQTTQNNILLNILNLKQFQAAPHDESLSPEKSKMSNQIQSHKLSQSMNKFFQKRKVIPDFNANQVNKKMVAEIRHSRNNINQQLDSLSQTNQSANNSFYKSVKRKDYLDGKQKEIFESLGIKNQYYVPGEKNFLENQMRKSQERVLSKSLVNIQQNSKIPQHVSQTEPQSIKKKRINPYIKKEKEFKEVYEKRMKELRRNTQNQLNKTPEYMSIKKIMEQPDISLYKERNDPYKILSNRIKTRAQMTERKFIDKNVKILERFFDPLRIRLRVMPVSRAPLVQGKNSDYYFVEAAKLSLKGDLTNAIEQLKKGLELKPNHMLCRFNHGVLMFKFGLIQEATNDFEMLYQKYDLKEPAACYNLSICLIQNGKYQEAFDMCQKVIESLFQSQNDKELLCDTYKLKGICAYRLGDPIESIKSYTLSSKLKQDIEREKRELDNQKKEPSGQELECIYINLFIEETRHIFKDQSFQRTLLRVSKSQKNLRPLIFDLQNFKRFGSEKNLEVKAQKDLRRSKEFQSKSKASLKQQQQQPIQISDQMSLNLEQQRPFAYSMKKAERKDALLQSIDKFIVQNPTVNQSPKRSSKNSNRHLEYPSVNHYGSKFVDKKKSALSAVSQTELNLLKNLIGIYSPPVKEVDEETRMKIIQKEYEEKFYKELKDMKSNLVNAGTSYRFEKIYAASTAAGANEEQQQDDDDMTKEERDELEKRRRIEQELLGSQVLKNMNKSTNNEDQDDKFLEFLISQNEIKTRQMVGSNNDNSFASVIKEQQDLEKMLKDLREKFIVKEEEWERDFAKEQKRLENQYYSSGGEDDEDLYDNDDLHGKSSKSLSIKKKKSKETVLDKLNKSLIDKEVTPDDVQNILVREIEDKQIKESQKPYKGAKIRKRLALRQVEVIRKEFKNIKVEENQQKSLKNLDKILRSLKFFQRFDEQTRSKIYLNAELISFPGQTIIFNQGDIGDKLYIILKGRVAVQINSAEYGNLPVVIATLNDGEQFGELSLIKLDKLQDNHKQGEINSIQEKKAQEYARRKATCLTVEQTDLLALPKEFSVHLYQPESAPKKKPVKKGGSKDVRSERISNLDMISQEEQDELNEKIQFLQSISLFEEIDAQLIMPIAVNMVPYQFNFGEYIIKEGEIPKGLYIIKSGQCKVASRRIASRLKQDSEQQQLNKKLGEKKKIKDKHPLFNEYDADNSILNVIKVLNKVQEVKSLNRVFQNDRIFVSGTGEQVKGKVEYQDIMVFSQLMPKNFFGGRVLLPFEMYMNMRRMCFGSEELERFYPKNTPLSFIENETEEQFQQKSLLSVIADSGEVEVYILDKNDMSYIPDFILRKIFEKIAVMREPDRPNSPEKIEEIKDAMIKWDKYKVKCVEKLFKEKQLLEKNSQIR